MSMARVVITAVVLEGRTKSAVARDYGVSRRWVQTVRPWSGVVRPVCEKTVRDRRLDRVASTVASRGLAGNQVVDVELDGRPTGYWVCLSRAGATGRRATMRRAR